MNIVYCSMNTTILRTEWLYAVSGKPFPSKSRNGSKSSHQMAFELCYKSNGLINAKVSLSKSTIGHAWLSNRFSFHWKEIRFCLIFSFRKAELSSTLNLIHKIHLRYTVYHISYTVYNFATTESNPPYNIAHIVTTAQLILKLELLKLPSDPVIFDLRPSSDQVWNKGCGFSSGTVVVLFITRFIIKVSGRCHGA